MHSKQKYQLEEDSFDTRHCAVAVIYSWTLPVLKAKFWACDKPIFLTQEGKKKGMGSSRMEGTLLMSDRKVSKLSWALAWMRQTGKATALLSPALGKLLSNRLLCLKMALLLECLNLFSVLYFIMFKARESDQFAVMPQQNLQKAL